MIFNNLLKKNKFISDSQDLITWSGFFLRLAFLLGIIFMVLYFFKGMQSNAFNPAASLYFATGDWIIQHHQWPTHDVFTWSLGPRQWTDYQLPFHLLSASARQLLGFQTVLHGFIFLGFLIIFIIPLVYHRQNNIPLILCLLPTAGALYQATHYFSYHPLIVSLAGLTILFFLVEHVRKQIIKPFYSFLTIAFLFAIWSNFHTGVILGFFYLMVVSVADFIQTRIPDLYTPEKSRESENEHFTLTPKSALLLLAGALIGGLCTAKTFGLYGYLLKVLQFGNFENLVLDAASPDMHLYANRMILFFFVNFTLLMIFAKNIMPLRDRLILWGSLFLGLYSAGFLPCFALYCSLLIPKHLHTGWNLLKKRFPRIEQEILLFNHFQRPLVILTSAFLLFFWLKPFPNAKKSLDKNTIPLFSKPLQYGLCESLMPGIDGYLRLKQPGDRIYHGTDFGNCMLLIPEARRAKIFIDSRPGFFSTKFRKQARELSELKQPWPVLSSYLEEKKINVIIIEKDMLLGKIMRKLPYAKIVYEDPTLYIVKPAKDSDFRNLFEGLK